MSWSNHRLQEEKTKACKLWVKATGCWAQVGCGGSCWMLHVGRDIDRAIVDRLVWQTLKHLTDLSDIASQGSTCFSMETGGRRIFRVNRVDSKYTISDGFARQFPMTQTY